MYFAVVVSRNCNVSSIGCEGKASCLFLYVIVPMLGPTPPFTLRIWNVPLDLMRAHILDDALLVFATFARLHPHEHMN
jgi:hypothetical protein